MSNQNKSSVEGLESQLFSWDGWEQFDTAGFIFTKVCLRVAIGPHAVGTVFDYANINYETSVIELGNNDSETPVFSGKLLVTVAV